VKSREGKTEISIGNSGGLLMFWADAMLDARSVKVAARPCGPNLRDLRDHCLLVPIATLARLPRPLQQLAVRRKCLVMFISIP
jgi:hypothetical protein